MSRHLLAWSVGFSKGASVAPDRWVAASVPGAVQLDWARAENWPPYWHGSNSRSYRWMEDVFWTYRARLDGPSPAAGERQVLVCGGVDYRFQVRVNGRLAHDQEGMFTPFELDLTEFAGSEVMIEIVVFPAPKAHSQPEDRSQARLSVKPAVSYGWDWHPRLIPLGIWEETFLEIRPALHLQRAEVRYRLADDFMNAELQFEAATAGPGRLSWTLFDPAGRSVLQRDAQTAGGELALSGGLPRPELWWPHDHGSQPLYRWQLELFSSSGELCDQRSGRIGLRRTRLVMHEGAWREPATFPKSRSHPPITLEINGRPIFVKGSNWVPPEIFPGIITAETYRPLLRLAREAHFNLLRCWGGAPVNKDSFFAQCDELGIMVWQEFPLACNLYGDGAPYLKVLEQDARSIATRVRPHPSLVLWCGGNELFNVWSGMTDQSLALRLLNKVCYELDPDTPFIPTAPVDGMGHGDYRFRDEQGREVYQIFAPSQHTAYTEFGCTGPSPVEYLKTFIPPEELWPPRPGAAWQIHHGLGAWDVDPTSHLFLGTSRHYFGEAADLPALVAQGEWLQTEAYKCIFEEVRRHKPMNAMAVNWCFNEPWPSAANASIINWPAQPKPAYFAVVAACRPVLASARLPKFSWRGGETFTAELWVLNDRWEEIAPGRITASLMFAELEIPLLAWDHGTVAANRNLAGPELRYRLPEKPGTNRFTLRLTAESQRDGSSEYTLHYQLPIPPPPEREPGMRLSRPLNV